MHRNGSGIVKRTFLAAGWLKTAAVSRSSWFRQHEQPPPCVCCIRASLEVMRAFHQVMCGRTCFLFAHICAVFRAACCGLDSRGVAERRQAPRQVWGKRRRMAIRGRAKTRRGRRARRKRPRCRYRALAPTPSRCSTLTCSTPGTECAYTEPRHTQIAHPTTPVWKRT